MDISIVIPSYNGKHLLDVSLPHLYRSIPKNISYEIILIDNGSTDQTEQEILNQYVKLDRNYGFTRAVNEGVKKATGKYILILNNDCFVEKDTITKLYDFLEKDHSLVATQPIITTQQGGIESIGYVVDLKKGKAEVVRSEDRILDWIPHQVRDDTSKIWNTGQVYGLSATCLMIKKEIFEKIGMFDESFHSYLEDVDLFIRLANNGYKYAPCLDSFAEHAHMATSKKMGSYKERHDFVNWIRIIRKNYPQSFIITNIFSLFIERLRNISGLMKALLS